MHSYSPPLDKIISTILRQAHSLELLHSYFNSLAYLVRLLWDHVLKISLYITIIFK